MSHSYIAYKREDELRVARLVDALRVAGLNIWFDQELPGGESWRANLHSKLSTAGCVVVVWSHDSTGPNNHWVLEEARSGFDRNILVPVCIDNVLPPLGFGEVQSIDLSHWKGALKDPFFQDLVNTIDAKLTGRPVPAPVGKLKRLRRRIAFASLSSAGLIAAASFAFNSVGGMAQVCTVSALQPGLSDTCGTLNLGGRPSRPERIAWEKRTLGSCDALRDHIRLFPDGVYAEDAANMLTGRRIETVDTWTATERSLPLVTLADGSAWPNEAAARSASLRSAQGDAERLCRGFGAGTLFRFMSAKPVAVKWSCDHGADGVLCSFDGEAQCSLKQRDTRERELCGR